MMKPTPYIKNPILKGFNPDPCLIRVNGDYYIITSTFEWVPGIPVYHSRDLVNWNYLTNIIKDDINFAGNPDSCSIWAPAISYCDGVFYVVYTDMKRSQYPFKDAHNYLITATDIMGPWSDPIYLTSGSFDPSLFHDSDGTKWYLDVLWDYRIEGRNKSAGISLQQYSVQEKKLVGPSYHIFSGTHLRKTEAPHLYKRNNYYYLITAEGGTGSTHAVTIARSKKITGPYEVDPKNPMLTAAHNKANDLQKSGHASLVHTQTDEWYIAHLCSRPIDGKYSILGRETALQRVYWTEDDWLRLECGGNEPQVIVKAPNLPEYRFPADNNEQDDFNDKVLHKVWHTLRTPLCESWYSLRERSGYLRIKGGESIHSLFNQHLIARRQQHFVCDVETKVAFKPQSFMQMAGLVLYYNTTNYLYLYLSYDDKLGKILNVMQSVKGEYELLNHWIPIGDEKECRLKAVIEYDWVQFFYSDDETWEPVGDKMCLSHLSDEGNGFTGNFVGMCVQDLSQANLHADFDYFYYTVRE